MSKSENLKDFRAFMNIGDIKHKNIHIHIEEPELSLYPESQRKLINFIVNRCFVSNTSDYNISLMIATHSPYIINHLNLLLIAGKKNQTYLNIQKPHIPPFDGEEIIIKEEVINDEMFDIQDLKKIIKQPLGTGSVTYHNPQEKKYTFY